MCVCERERERERERESMMSIYDLDDFTRRCVRKSRAEEAAEKWRKQCRRFEDYRCDALIPCVEAMKKINTKAPDHRIAIIADVQCADHDDDWNFAKTQKRYFRHALRSTALAVKMWNSIPDLELIMQLGDLIDGKNSNIKGESERMLEKVHDIFKTCKTKQMEHLIGNHELYNFDRTFMQKHKLLQLPSPFWHVRDIGKKWRFVMLDAYVVSYIYHSHTYHKDYTTQIQVRRFDTFERSGAMCESVGYHR